MISSCRFDIILRILKKIKTSTEDGSEQGLPVSDLTLLRELVSQVFFFSVYVCTHVCVCSYVCRYTRREVCVHKCMEDMDILRY